MSFAGVVAVVCCGCVGEVGPGAEPSPDAGDSEVVPDAGGATEPDAAVDEEPETHDVSCAGLPLPTTAPDPLTVNGVVLELVSKDIVAGAKITAHRRSDDSVIASATAAADGSFALTVATGGAPLDAYMTVSAPGLATTTIYPGYPLHKNHFLRVTLLEGNEVGLAYVAAGTTKQAGTASVLVVGYDCLEDQAPSEISITPAPGVTKYLDVETPVPTFRDTPPRQSIAVGFNVDPANGPVQISGQLQGAELRSHQIPVAPDGLYITFLRP